MTLHKGDYQLRDIVIINNTIYRNGTSADAWEDGGINILKVNPEELLICNNIISRNATYAMCIRSDVSSFAVVINHNLFEGIRSLADERSGRNPIFRSPSFAAGDPYDFHLTAKSETIGKGRGPSVPQRPFAVPRLSSLRQQQQWDCRLRRLGDGGQPHESAPARYNVQVGLKT